jgi:hypothetical protein
VQILILEKMKSIYITLFAFLFLFSCKGDNEETQEPNDVYMLKGKYNLVTLTSDIPLDLDHNGISTTDMLQELDFAYSNNNNFKYMKFDVKGPFFSDNYYLFDGWVLTADFTPQHDDYNISYVPLPFNGRIFKYDKNTNTLEYEANPPFVYEPQFPGDIDTRTAPTITNMEILPDMKIKITMKHRYTETPETYPDCWTNVVLTAVYEKYTDNPD